MKQTNYIPFAILAVLLLLGGTGFALFTKQNTATTPLQASMIETVTSSQFKNRTEEESRILLDVRTPAEYSQGHIKGSTNIDFHDPSFIEKLETLDKNAAYSIYCRSGNRSGQATEVMESLGFTNVLDLSGGVISWEQNGNSLCTEC